MGQIARKRGPGRPSAYRSEYDELARNYCLLGATDAELGKFFKVTETTIQNWKRAQPTFFASIKAGRAIADSKVARALYERAVGYSHPEERVFVHEGEVTVLKTIRHYAPDTAAASLWLRNRRPALWRNRTENAGADGRLAARAEPDLSRLSEEESKQYRDLMRTAARQEGT